MTSAGIDARAVRRSFGHVHAVRDVTLRVEPGRVTGLVGPNGAGKTTLLLMLASLLAPDAGEIRIAGIDPMVDPARARGALGWMPDALGAWPALTARETLAMTGRFYGMPNDHARSRADALLEQVGLTSLADAPARVLSRGQKQRLALGRALVHDPSVLLLDEPASGLDPQARVDLRILLRALAAEGRSILVSSHVLSELEEVVDDAVFLMNGETVAHDRVARAAGRAREWRLRLVRHTVADERGAVAAALNLDVHQVSVDRRDLIVAFSGEVAAAEGLHRLVGAGLAVSEYAPATGDLEHTFLDLDRSDGPDDGPSSTGGAA